MWAKMYADSSQSDMSRLTTMLTNVGAVFERSYGPNGMRIIEIGPVRFEFATDGTLLALVVEKQGNAPKAQ